MKTKIYILEDEPLIAETIKTSLEKEGYEICGMADNVKEAAFDVETLQPDLILVDITLDGDLDGIDFVHHLKKKTHRQFHHELQTLLAFQRGQCGCRRCELSVRSSQ